MIFSNHFFSFLSLLLSHLCIYICLVFSSSSSYKFFLVCFKVEDSRRSIKADPIINFLPVYIDTIYQNRMFSTTWNKSIEVFDDFTEGQFFSIFWSN